MVIAQYGVGVGIGIPPGVGVAVGLPPGIGVAGSRGAVGVS